jgi:WD40 repeat protein
MEWEKKTVFISSTFNDMHAERDYLVKEVFPELTEWCEERKIRLTDIDLRWGVTEEDSNNSKTIETCLRHIDKSRPFFLCFLGQRRGWIPNFEEDINDETKKRYTSIDDLDGRSATEMEIEHALLKPIHMFLEETDYDCPSSKHSLFFFRDDSYLDELTDYQRLIYTNESEGDEDKIRLADEELAKTKDKIRDRKACEDDKPDSDESKINVLISEYEGHWDKDLILPELNPTTDSKGRELYAHNENQGRLSNFESNGEPLKDVIIRQLKEQLAIAFPEHMEITHESDLQKDLDQQDIFCYLNSEGFVPRPEYTEKLTSYVEDSSNDVCLVTAEAGYGKTMLLAKFATDFGEKYENKRLYKRFCGASDLSSKTYSLWKSIIDEAGIDENESFYPKNINELKRNISEILSAIAEKGDSVIIIDAVNQMPDGIKMLSWFDKLPENLKLIFSVKEDRQNEEFNSNIERIKGRGNVSTFEIKELDDDGKKQLIKEYLKNYLKQLDDEQIDVICSFKGSKNPLYLKILLAELRVFGSFDQLKGEIQKFGDDPLSAFNHVFERLEEDEITRGDKAKIVRPLFSLLASSRVGGLSEDEIVTIITDKYGFDEDDVRANVNLNLRQVRPFMARKEKRHDFFYEKFREAAEKRYEGDYKDNIELLTDYFKDKSSMDEARRYVELPYYLNESGRIEELEKTLSSYSFIKNKLYKTEDIYGLISDYNYLDFENDEDGPLELIQRGLELSSPVLVNDPKQLPVQLWGRMNEIKDETIEVLLNDLVEDAGGEWLKPTTSALYSPKSSIIKRLLPDGNKSSSQIAAIDDERIIFGSSDGVLSIYDVNDNSFDVLEKTDSKIVRTILAEDESLYVARSSGQISKWDLSTRDSEDFPQIDAEITDIYISKTYNKIYASSHTGIFSIDLDTKELKNEVVEPKNYNQILVPRRNEAILVCDEREVDGWDVYEMRKAYNRHHQQNDEEDDGTKLDSSEEIRFMGLNKRFLTLISENGQMKFWNTLKNSGGGESIDEARVCSPNDRFKQAITLEDEDKIVTISEMGVLKVYNIPQPRQPKFNVEVNENTGMEMDIQTGIKSPTSLDYLNDGDKRWIIVGNENNDVSIVDLNKKVLESTNVRHAESVLSIKVDGNRMITASDNGEVFTWDIDSEECVNRFANDFRCNSISYNRGESRLVLAGVKTDKNDKKINKIATCDVSDEMWNAIDAPESESIELSIDNEESGMGEVVEITQNGSGIVFIEEDKLTIHNDEYGLSGTATSLDAVLDSTDAFVGFEDGSIVRYPSQDAFEGDVASPVTKIKISGGRLIAGYEDGSVEIYDLNGAHLTSLEGHEKAINNIYVDDSLIITVSKDNALKIWENDLCRYTYYLDIYATAVNIRGDKLIVGDTLGNVRFFELNDLI